jgi:hypothetical protein
MSYAASRCCTARAEHGRPAARRPRRARPPWRAGAALLAALLLLLGSRAARAEDDADPRRTVAVLAFRTGAADLPQIDRRLADILRAKTSLEVIDAIDARRRYGNRLDGDVVGCSGDAACIAGIGRKLGARDVVLVGISRFGDVILTLQRIDVQGRDVRGRIAEALAPDATPDADTLLEYLQRVMPKSDFLRFGVLRIQANIAGAEVVIGGETRGRTPLQPLRLPAPERYDIRITKKGYTAFEAVTSVPPDSDVVVRATLAQAETVWYRRWWVWTLAGTVAVSTAAVVILASDRDVPVTVDVPR